MKKFKKNKLLIAFMAVIIANSAYAEKSDENELIILGNYFKNHNNPKKQNAGGGITVPTDPDNNIPDNDGSEEPDNPVDPDEHIIPVDPVKLVVVKENDKESAWKLQYGNNLSYNVSGDISSVNTTALWMTDRNTVVTNNNTLESDYSTTNENNNQYTVHVENNASFINNGIINGNNVIGVYLENADSFENSTGASINNTGSYGVRAFNTKEIKNNGLIQNTGDYGLYASDVSYIENKENGIIANIGNYGVFLKGQDSIFINNGTIANSGKYGLHIVDGSAINYGIIENNSSWGIKSDENATAENYGIIRNGSSAGMGAINGGTVINHSDGVISNLGENGMYATSNSKAINYGIIENLKSVGMIISGENALGINNGEIRSNGVYGMQGDYSGEIINNGKIINNGNFGMLIFDDGTRAINNNVIENKGNNGMGMMEGSGYIENNGTIQNTGDNGISVNGSGYAKNNGTIKNLGDYATSVTSTGIIENNGIIELTGDNKTGMTTTGGGISINNGTIKMNGQNTVGIYASNGTVINQGNIIINGSGHGIAAYNNSHVILGEGSTITINSSSQTYNGTETGGDGTYVYVDGTSDINNKGVITSDSRITVDGNGKFVVNSTAGGLRTKKLILNNNLYMGSEAVMNSSEDKYVLKNIDADEITGNGRILSDSIFFETETEKKNDGYQVVMKRIKFNNPIKSTLGEVLENNYSGSENDAQKNKIYNSLKAITDSQKLLTAEDEMTGSSAVNNQTYQLFTQDRLISQGIDQLMSRRTESVDNGIYANFLYNQTKADTKNGFEGYNGKSTGIILGGMKKITENTAVGGFLGYLNTDINYKDSSNTQKLETWSLTGALNTELTDKILWRNRVNYNFGSNDSERRITFDNSNREVNSSFDSWSAGGVSELEYTQKINDIISFRPSAGVRLDYLKESGYTENGADGLNLEVDSNDAFSGKIGAGVKVDINAYKGQNSALKLTPNMNYAYELGNPYDKRAVKLSAFEGKMDINERDTGKNSLNLGLDLEYNYKNKFSVYAGYNAGVLSDKDSAFTAGFKYQF